MIDKNQIVSIEVVVKPESGNRSLFEQNAMITPQNVEDFAPPHAKNVEVARKLKKNGFDVHKVGKYSISASSTVAQYERFFNTTIAEKTRKKTGPKLEDMKYYSPKAGATWRVEKVDDLDKLIDRAYIQHDPTFFADERAVPPFWNDKFRLRLPGDVAQLMNASTVHKRGITGKGVRVAMPDSGFYHHKYYKEQGYNILSVCAPDTTDHASDDSGHGTGEAANLLAVAPGINFIGVKINNTVLGFSTAVELDPDVITCSWGYSMDKPDSEMPNWLKPLHAVVLDAVARGIIVCFSAGNGHYGFPGSMPEVISVGGVTVTEKLMYSATQYTSGFESTWFPGRKVPDISGLCGEPPGADYLVLPVQVKSDLDKDQGWGAFSGTSAASPMVAGVCALMKEIDKKLPAETLKHILCYTAKDVVYGENAMGEKATPGPDLATGYGLVDAGRAIEVLL